MRTVFSSYLQGKLVLTLNPDAKCKLGDEYDTAKTLLQCLKVVEYVGPLTLETCFSSSTVDLKVHVFQLHANAPSDDSRNEESLLGELISMPNTRFEGVWDE